MKKPAVISALFPSEWRVVSDEYITFMITAMVRVRMTMITTKSMSNKSRSNTMKPIKNIVKNLRNNIMKTIKNIPLKKSYVIYVGVKSVEVAYQSIRKLRNVNHLLNLLRMRNK